MSKLNVIKFVHTIIWIFFNVVLVYMAYAVIANNINKYVWMGIALIVLEGLVLLIYKMQCPLTIMARRYSYSTKHNFDIFLPDWLAKHNKLIYTIIFVIIICLLIYRLIANEN